MTSNQLAYWSLQETKRANLAREGFNERSLLETTRHNQRSEDIGLTSAGAAYYSADKNLQATQYSADRSYLASENRNLANLGLWKLPTTTAGKFVDAANKYLGR